MSSTILGGTSTCSSHISSRSFALTLARPVAVSRRARRQTGAKVAITRRLNRTKPDTSGLSRASGAPLRLIDWLAGTIGPLGLVVKSDAIGSLKSKSVGLPLVGDVACVWRLAPVRRISASGSRGPAANKIGRLVWRQAIRHLVVPINFTHLSQSRPWDTKTDLKLRNRPAAVD